MGTEQLLPVNGVEICAQTYGDAGDPALVLLAGMSSSMDHWDDELCQRLADGDRRVVRFDHRDTGRSTSYPPGEPGYTTSDLRDDVVGLLDALGIGSAHLIGISMGGGIAQCLAVDHPERVATLTLVDTSPALGGAVDLPPPEPEMLAFFEAAGTRPEPDWSDPRAVVDMLVEDEAAFMRGDVDLADVRAKLQRTVDRARSVPSFVNHGQLDDGREVVGALADIAAPTLVVHGTADPLFPLAHGEALAAAIPDATLLTLAGVGHQHPPPANWDVFVPAVLRHTGD